MWPQRSSVRTLAQPMGFTPQRVGLGSTQSPRSEKRGVSREAQRLLHRFVAPRGAKPPRHRPPGTPAASKLTAAMTRTIPVAPVAAARREIVRPRGALPASRVAANEK